jgi:hypothetical protein
VAGFADELAAADLHLAADRHHVGTAFDRPAFERAIVDVHLLRLLLNLAAALGIVDDQVGVAASANEDGRVAVIALNKHVSEIAKM